MNRSHNLFLLCGICLEAVAQLFKLLQGLQRLLQQVLHLICHWPVPLGLQEGLHPGEDAVGALLHHFQLQQHPPLKALEQLTDLCVNSFKCSVKMNGISFNLLLKDTNLSMSESGALGTRPDNILVI